VAGWLMAAYAVVLLLLLAGSGYLALHEKDKARQEAAYKVLRLLITAGGLLGLLAKLHEFGLLR
jgi:cobalamin biosynthesis protein CobD/CbiB